MIKTDYIQGKNHYLLPLNKPFNTDMITKTSFTEQPTIKIITLKTFIIIQKKIGPFYYI